MPLSAGDKLGHYEILAQIGAGGMGEVYKARDTRLGRVVAVKTSKLQFTERFDREARSIAALNHPNICTLHDVGPNYLVMEFVEGAPIKGPLPLDEALRLARQITSALEAAHEKHIIHRDLKPANIMVKPDGSIKVLDFGLAKVAPPVRTDLSPENSPTLTMGPSEAGLILGTAAYMAPEQAKAIEVDKRADIWSFGVVLYELVTGSRPFHGKDVPEILASVIKEQPDFEPIPFAIRRLIRKCLEKDPAQRLRDIGDVWDLIDEPPPAKHAKIPWIGAAVLAAATAVALWSPWRSAPPEPEIARLQLTLTGRNVPIELSPDGRLLSFSGSLLKRRAIWIRALDSSEARALQGTEDMLASWFWSPDSRFIAFGQDGKLKKIDVRSGVVSILVDKNLAPRGGSWSEAGILIIGSAMGIQRVNLADGTVTLLTQVDKATGADHIYPQFLPDGRHFVYVDQAAGFQRAVLAVGSIDLLPAQQPAQALITAQGGASLGRVYFVPASAAGPAKLVFRRDNTVLAQTFDPVKLTLSGEPVPISEANVGYFSAAPGVLAYSTATGAAGSQLTVYERGGKEVSKLGAPVSQFGVNVSADGSRVAVPRQTTTRNLWALELNRDASTKVTSDEAFADGGVFSPDGKSLVYASRRNSQGTHLFRRAANGTGEEQPLLKNAGFAQDWSRDGKFILYATNNSMTDKTAPNLMVLPMEGDKPGKPFPYLAAAARETQGKFSPDGNWVAYASDESGVNQIFVSSFPDPAKSKIPIATGNLPRWGRDGKELFFFAPDDTLMSVAFSISGGVFKPGPPKVLFKAQPYHSAGTDTWGTGWDTVPGGRFLINVAGDAVEQPPVSVVLNWQSALKQLTAR